MKRVAAGLGLSLAALLLVPASAQADPSLCLDVSIDVNGQGGAQAICLPPEGGEAPGVPTLPGLPS